MTFSRLPAIPHHPQLLKDTTSVGDFPLCHVLLNRDDSVPWIILAPKVHEITEFHHLAVAEQQQFLLESQWVCEALTQLFSPDKLNTGALGNLVPQLHIHHIARYKTDLAWPGPIWGNAAGHYRSDAAQLALSHKIADQLANSPSFQRA